MQKRIYEYSLDKIFIGETIEKYNQFDNSVILPQFYTEIKPVFNSNTHFAIFDESSQTWSYKEFSPLGVFYNKQNMTQIEVKSQYDVNYSADLYTNIKPLVINEGDNLAFNNSKQEWEYSTKGSITIAQELQSKNELLVLAKATRKEYIIKKRSDLTDRGTVEHNGNTYANAQNARTAINYRITLLDDIQTKGYFTYPEQQFVQLSKADFKAIALLIETDEMNLRQRQRVALQAINNATTAEEVNSIEL